MKYQHIEMPTAAATGTEFEICVQGDTLRQCKNYAFQIAFIIQAESAVNY